MNVIPAISEGTAAGTSSDTPTPPQVVPVFSPNDPNRIRGDALRASLYFTLVAWIPGAFWQAATAGAGAVKLGEYLGANDFVFSLLGAAPLVGVLFQLPGSVVSDLLGKRKKFFIWTVTPHRALYILIGLLPWIMPRHAAWPAMFMALLILVSMALNHFGGQAWISWMADLVPPRIRGKYFARRSRVGVAVFALTSLSVAFILDFSNQDWFKNLMAPASSWADGMPPLIILISIIFMIAGAVGMLDILAFTKVEEPPMKAVPREPLVSRIIKPLHDSPFRRFVIYWSCWTFAVSFTGWLWWVYMLDFLKTEHAKPVHAWWADHMYVTATLILSVAFQCGGFLGYPIWGRAVDRFGRKPVLFISSTLHSFNWIWWILLSPVMLPWLLLTQFTGGFASGGQDIASFNMMLHFNRRGGAAYQSLGAVIFGIAGALGAVASGSLATALEQFQWTFAPGTAWEHTFNRYAVLIAVGILLKYGADLLLLPHIKDTGDRPRAHALRFVFDNMYGSLNTLIFEPIKTGVEYTSKGLNTLSDTISGAGSGFRRWWR